jgi:hypothetical protein
MMRSNRSNHMLAALGWWHAQGWVPPRAGFAYVWAWVRIGFYTPFAILARVSEPAVPYSRRTAGAERDSAAASAGQSASERQ